MAKKIIAPAVLFLILFNIALALFGHPLIEKAYLGDSTVFGVPVMAHKALYSLGYYLDLATQQWLGWNLLSILVYLMVIIVRKGSASALLLGLMLCDFTFLYLHFHMGLYFNITHDRGFPEIFQYFKEITAAAVFLRIFIIQKEPFMLSFSILFSYLFFDDSFLYHEKVGIFLAPFLSQLTLLKGTHLPSRDIGELLAELPIVSFFTGLILITLFRSKLPRIIKTRGFILFVLVCCLAFFGVFLDLASRLDFLAKWAQPIEITEDFGEMLVMSLVLSYAFYFYYYFKKEPRV